LSALAGLAEGIAAVGTGAGTCVLRAAVTLDADIGLVVGVLDDLGDHRIGVFEVVGLGMLGLLIGRLGVGILVRCLAARRGFLAFGLGFVVIVFALGILERLLQALLGRRRIAQLDRIEVVGNGSLGLFVGGIDQPHDQKERHHRRHEVGVGDLPGAAMGAIVIALVALDDDDFIFAVVMAFALAH